MVDKKNRVQCFVRQKVRRSVRDVVDFGGLAVRRSVRDVVDFGGLADVGQNAQLVASACGGILNRSLRCEMNLCEALCEKVYLYLVQRGSPRSLQAFEFKKSQPMCARKHIQAHSGYEHRVV
jgi:hypothetical protein